MKMRRIAASFVLAMGSVSVLSQPATAGHGTWYVPDNANQYISGSSLTSFGVIARDHGKNQLERSDITTYWGSNDIDVRDAYYGDDAGFLGQTSCTVQTLTGRCDVYVVKFNESSIPPYNSMWQYTGCHEFGHTGSLNHRYSGSSDSDNNSCMREDHWNVSGSSLDGHDINAINAHF
ncbi:hypothetical protein ABGB12_21440 [Actinocorallia sp. B10E7]|uniref:hypothetical protein n=1 Tax=Actinocorallia sp. B10E7 TaxID=3153558 RepID=UPI00325C8AD8